MWITARRSSASATQATAESKDDKGKAKAYQVRQVLLAIDKLEGLSNER